MFTHEQVPAGSHGVRLAMIWGQPFNPYKSIRSNALVPWGLLGLSGVSLGAKLLYGVLRRYAGKDGFCHPSRAQLAEDLGVSMRSITSYIADLKQAGLIGEPQRPRGGVNYFTFLMHPCLGLSETPAEEYAPNRQEKAQADERVETETGGILPDRVEESCQTDSKDSSTVRGSSKEGHLKGSYITHAEGVNGSAGCHELKDGCEEETSVHAFLRAQADIWRCKLHLSPERVRFLNSFGFSPGLVRALQHALIARAGEDATEAVMKTANSYKRHGVGAAWDPECIRNSLQVFGEEYLSWDFERWFSWLLNILDALGTAGCMWNYVRAEPRPVWQRQAIAEFLKSSGVFDDEWQFLTPILTLLDCCRWCRPRRAEELLPRLRLLWKEIGGFPSHVIRLAIADYLEIQDGDGFLQGHLVEDIAFPSKYTSERNETPPFPSVPVFLRIANFHQDWDQEERQCSADEANLQPVPEPERMVEALEAAELQRKQTPDRQHISAERSDVSEILDSSEARILVRHGGTSVTVEEFLPVFRV